MAQKQPGFITGANAKIKTYGKTMAYCSDVSYNITVQTIPVESMGKYEVHSNEPVAYSVDGTFSVIRYTANATADNIGGVITDAADGKNNAPEGIEDGANGNMSQHIDPSQILGSQTFDLEIYEKRQAAGSNAGAVSDTQVFVVEDCRLTRRGMTLNKRGVMVDNYAFVGILASDKDTSTQVGGSGDEDVS